MKKQCSECGHYGNFRECKISAMLKCKWSPNIKMPTADCCPVDLWIPGLTIERISNASALWRELKRRQGNGLVPLREEWIAVTEKRMAAAMAKVFGDRQ